MKEVPILFSTEMVKAILDDRKTQTRREIKAPRGAYGFFVAKNKSGEVTGVYAHDADESTEKKDGSEWVIKPKAKPGDLLWVRETHIETPGGKFHYKADISDEKDANRKGYIDIGESWAKWKPSIHMRKGGARIWLRVTDVKVERLNEISESDAASEGIEHSMISGKWICYGEDSGRATDDATISYLTLWTSINGPGSWQLNPWVWVYEFEVVSKTGKPSIHETEIKK